MHVTPFRGARNGLTTDRTRVCARFLIRGRLNARPWTEALENPCFALNSNYVSTAFLLVPGAPEISVVKTLLGESAHAGV